VSARCGHEATSTGAPRPYAGPVARDEVRAAHGNVCLLEVCETCGSERLVNANSTHREEGPWGPTRLEREAARSRERREREARVRRARSAAESHNVLFCVLDDGTSFAVAIDRQGYLIVNPADGRVTLPVIEAAAPALVAAARELRAALIRLAEAQS